MKPITKILLGILIAIFCSTLHIACSKDDSNNELDASFYIDTKSIVADANGQVEYISLKTDEEWVAYSDASWTQISPDYGYESTDVKVTVFVNKSSESRDCIIQFMSLSSKKVLSVKVHQKEQVDEEEEEEEEDTRESLSKEAVFTVGKDNHGYVLYVDYGGLVYPYSSSITELTGSPDGLKVGERGYLYYSYYKENIKEKTGKGYYIDGAYLYGGIRIPKTEILTRETAQTQKLLVEDSIFQVPTDITAGAYRGYLTTQFVGEFSIVSNKGVYPTLNMVYNPAENTKPNELNLTMYYNRHTRKDAPSYSEKFFTTYPLSDYTTRVSGRDSIRVSLNGQGLSKPITFKIGREDLEPSNYLYFKYE